MLFKHFTNRMLKAVILLLLPASVLCTVDCNVLGDGTYELGCKAYVVCLHGVSTQTECALRMVYNNKTKKCDHENNVLPPCGLIRDCSHTPDGSYADKELNCTSYFTCSHHVYFGHNYCTPGTVFNDALGTCDWPSDVDPPCGTKQPTTTPIMIG